MELPLSEDEDVVTQSLKVTSSSAGKLGMTLCLFLATGVEVWRGTPICDWKVEGGG